VWSGLFAMAHQPEPPADKRNIPNQASKNSDREAQHVAHALVLRPVDVAEN
jgi:hypothetical protein